MKFRISWSAQACQDARLKLDLSRLIVSLCLLSFVLDPLSPDFRSVLLALSTCPPVSFQALRSNNKTVTTILDSIIKTVEESQSKQWPDAVDDVLFAHRTSKHNSTGHTPFNVMHLGKPYFQWRNHEQGLSGKF